MIRRSLLLLVLWAGALPARADGWSLGLQGGFAFSQAYVGWSWGL